MGIVEAWRHRRAAKRLETIHVELFNDEGIDYAIPLTRGLLRRLKVETLHRLVINAPPERLEAIRWELTRRQGLPALRVSLMAFAVSAAALFVSIIWHK